MLKNNGKLESVVSHIGTAKQWTQKFSYDSIGRLKQSEERRGDTNALTYKQTFDFDRFGNLYRKPENNDPTGQQDPLVYTPIEETTTPNTGDIDKSTNRFRTETLYDDAGNVLTDDKFRDMSFGYDANGRMVKAAKPNVPDALSVYDASGLRVAEKVNDVWRFVINDVGGKCVAEYGGMASSDEGGVKYVLQDWQGSTRAIVGNNGYVQSRSDYTAYGEDVGSGTGLRTPSQGFGISDSLRQRYGLTERDDATGLDHTWFRKNENRAGRWTSPDPYNGSMRRGSPQSFNRYSYVSGQPTNFVDPSGLYQQGADQACETQSGSGVYDGRIIDGRCVAYGTSPVNIYWTGGWINMGGNNTTWVPAGGYPDIRGGGGGGGGSPSVGPTTGPPSSPTNPQRPCGQFGANLSAFVAVGVGNAPSLSADLGIGAAVDLNGGNTSVFTTLTGGGRMGIGSPVESMSAGIPSGEGFTYGAAASFGPSVWYSGNARDPGNQGGVFETDVLATPLITVSRHRDPSQNPSTTNIEIGGPSLGLAWSRFRTNTILPTNAPTNLPGCGR